MTLGWIATVLLISTPVWAVDQCTTPETDVDWEARAVAGFHQSGASSAESTQNFFFDFFIARGLSDHAKVYDTFVSVWGNVRIASTPQQVTIPVSQFVSQFAAQAGTVKVNELAQSAGFETGLEFKLRTFRPGLAEARMLGAIGSIGATGNFSTGLQQTHIYARPAANSPQRELFDQRFPSVTTDYVALVPPLRERFYRQWWMGARLTTFDLRAPYAAPATYAVTFGQDETVTGGSWDGVVGRIDVFYPLPIGKVDGRFRFAYFFGTGNFRIKKETNETPLLLKEVTASVSAYDRRVTVIAVPTTRDTYRIGFGIDLVNLLRSWKN